jgi:hypothetical protein
MSLDKIKPTLTFLRLTDEQGNLSLTNLALMLTLIKVLTSPGVELPELLTFVATIVGYQAKRYMTGTPATATEDAEQVKAAIEALQTKVSALQVGSVLKPGQR